MLGKVCEVFQWEGGVGGGGAEGEYEEEGDVDDVDEFSRVFHYLSALVAQDRGTDDKGKGL